MASSSDDDEDAFEKFLSSMKKNGSSGGKVPATRTAIAEKVETKENVEKREWRHSDQSSSSSNEEFEDAVEDIVAAVLAEQSGGKNKRAEPLSSFPYTMEEPFVASKPGTEKVLSWRTAARPASGSPDEEDDAAFENLVSSIKNGRNGSRSAVAVAESPVVQQVPARSSRFSDSSSDDDNRFEMLVSAIKAEKKLPKSKSVPAMDSFIVDDDDDELDQTWTSGSSDAEDEEEEASDDEENVREGGEENEDRTGSSSPDSISKSRKLFVRLQLEDDFRRERAIFGKPSPLPLPKPPSSKKQLPSTDTKVTKKVKEPIVEEFKRPIPQTPIAQPAKPAVRKEPIVQKQEKPVDVDAEFLYKLSEKEASYLGANDEAKKLRRAFVKSRMEMANRVTDIMNRRVFNSKMPLEVVTVEFTKRLLKTAGDTTTRGVTGSRQCRIRLADKVCDTPGRLRDTLIHELCHAAVSLIDGVLHHRHGPLWINWTRIVAKTFPSLPPVTVCHRYAIQTKYVYACQTCDHKYGRHSKSIDVNTQLCGYCHGKLALMAPVAGASSGEQNPNFTTPRTEKPKNAWTTFVSANFGSVKREMPPKSAHKEIMTRLKVMYQSERAARIAPDDDFKEPERLPPPITPVIGLQTRKAKETSAVDEQIDLILASSFSASCVLNADD